MCRCRRIRQEKETVKHVACNVFLWMEKCILFFPTVCIQHDSLRRQKTESDSFSVPKVKHTSCDWTEILQQVGVVIYSNEAEKGMETQQRCKFALFAVQKIYKT